MNKKLPILMILGALLLSFSLGNAQTLLINEFLASNDSTLADEYGDFDDWVEIYNASSDPIDIGGMYITDDLTDPTTWQIPDTSADLTTIPPKGFLIIWCDKESEEGVLHAEIKLSGGGEQIGIFAADGVTPIDTLTFGEQTTDVSYGRTTDGGDEWAFFTEPTPGRINNPNLMLYINEFLASNDTTFADEFGGYDDWIEIYNAGDEPVDVGGMYITDDLADTTQWQIPANRPDSTTIAPGGFLLLWCDKESEQGVLHVEFKLSGGGEQIGLFASDGLTAIDTLTYGDQNTDVSYGRLPDGSDHWEYFTTPTPGKTNSTTGITDRARKNLATDFQLGQNFPNPFNPETMISFRLPQSEKVMLTIFNVQGKEIRNLINDEFSAGSHRIKWDGRDNSGNFVASGVYLYKITAGDFHQARKMLLLK
ncbi:hypothetical protein B6D60_00295 [candidate division KSB1 bacterium 4484_87]|nr:MAG: hypothetical protein B6D60_00295 [candidate division KSB1 bacterium 4484_87]